MITSDSNSSKQNFVVILFDDYIADDVFCCLTRVSISNYTDR